MIDTHGLNDWVVARHRVSQARSRRMAHDRRPPPGYVACFRPNLEKGESGIVALERVVPLTSEAIEHCEQHWRARSEEEL